MLQYPTANALAVSKGVLAEMEQLAKQFPPGIHYTVAFNTTDFVAESIKEVVITLLLSIVLVVLVIYVFLQNPKSTLIPAVTIPVSLIGTFFVMKIFGFTINTITLFGLTLATGLVVDDAIVVIENIARHIEMNKGRQSGVASAAQAMREIQSAVVASSLVLLAVFIPVAFFPGTTGLLYKQFALTIAAAITISLFQALTLAPVMSARLLTGDVESKFIFFRWFNAGLARFRRWYAAELPSAIRYRWLGDGRLRARALGDALHVREDADRLHPERGSRLLHRPGSSTGGHVARRRDGDRRKGRGDHPQPAAGEVSLRHRRLQLQPARRPTAASCSACSNRGASARAAGDGIDAVIGRINFAFFTQVPQAQLFALNPPAINGVGSFGGFQFELEDRGNARACPR